MRPFSPFADSSSRACAKVRYPKYLALGRCTAFFPQLPPSRRKPLCRNDQRPDPLNPMPFPSSPQPHPTALQLPVIPPVPDPRFSFMPPARASRGPFQTINPFPPESLTFLAVSSTKKARHSCRASQLAQFSANSITQPPPPPSRLGGAFGAAGCWPGGGRTRRGSFVGAGASITPCLSPAFADCSTRL